MNGYLQRLLDTAAPAPDRPTLTPVVKSASPIFEQNQLPGLIGLYAGEGEAGVTPHPGAAPGAWAARAPGPPPPAPAPAVPMLQIARPDPLPATPSRPDAAARRPVAADPRTPRVATSDPPSPLPELPPERAPGPVPPDPERIEPAPRLEPVLPAEPLGVTAAPAPLMPLAAVVAPAAIERVARGAAPAIGPEVDFQPEPREALARPSTRAALPALTPVEPVGDAPPRPSVLEPRPRPDFDAADPEIDERAPAPLVAPRITIGRVTVALVPDPAPAAKAAAAPRTAAAASLIGPLGNRRARRRLFALARL